MGKSKRDEGQAVFLSQVEGALLLPLISERLLHLRARAPKQDIERSEIRILERLRDKLEKSG